jgi:hypothetical protein
MSGQGIDSGESECADGGVEALHVSGAALTVGDVQRYKEEGCTSSSGGDVLEESALSGDESMDYE